MTFFETSFGDRIEFVDGYRQSFPPTPRRESNIAKGFDSSSMPPFKISGFVKDRYLYALIVDFLHSIGERECFPKALDIGAAEGTQARYLRGSGKCDYVVAVDIVDQAWRLSTSRFVRSHLTFAYHQLIQGLKKWLLFPGLPYRSNLISRRSLSQLDRWSTHLYELFGWVPDSSSTYYKLRLRRRPVIDDYIVGDAMDVDGEFDLITAFGGLEYFDVEEVMAKVGSLLNEDGIFAFVVDYWWHPVNVTSIVGDFPYACQRLNRDDFRRYMAEFHADEVDDVMEMYDYFSPTHPTLTTYGDVGEKNDLWLVGYHRLPVPENTTAYHSKLGPAHMNRFGDAKLTAVLDNIRRFRSDVTLADLNTYYLLMVFKKQPSYGRRSLREAIASGTTT